ncbi:MAG: hypothetical protein ABIC57_03580 [bacterium]
MQIHYLRKALSRIGNSVRSLYSNINFPTLYKASFIGGYLLVCILILIPGIDYQSWYPNILERFDYELSQDFSDHKSLVITVEKKEYIPATIEIIKDRLSELRALQSRTEIDSTQITFHLPSYLSDQTIEYLSGKGEIKIQKRKEDAPTDYSAASLYDPTYYEETDLDLSKVSDTRIVEVGEGYTAIEITSKESNTWNSLSDSLAASSLGVFVDGKVYLGQIVPKGDGVPKPRLVVFSEEQEVFIITSQLRNDPLDSIRGFSIKEERSIYNVNFGISLIVAVLLSVTSGLVYRLFIEKDITSNVAQTALIVTGVLTISKIIPITWGIVELISLSIILLSISITEKKNIVYFSIFLIILGIILNQFIPESLFGTSKLMYVSGICSLLMYLTLFFTGIYEDR